MGKRPGRRSPAPIAIVVDRPTEARSSNDGSHVLIAFEMVGGGELQVAIPQGRATEVVGLLARAAGLAARARSDDRDIRQVFPIDWLGVARDKDSGETVLTFRLAGGMEFCFEVSREIVAHTVELLTVRLGEDAPLPPPGASRH